MSVQYFYKNLKHFFCSSILIQIGFQYQETVTNHLNFHFHDPIQFPSDEFLTYMLCIFQLLNIIHLPPDEVIDSLTFIFNEYFLIKV